MSTPNQALMPLAMAVPGSNIEAYVSSIHQLPILSVQEEKALAERYFHESDLEAARQLVMSHLRFVVHIARSYSGYGLAQSDLIQEGNIGLMKAVKRFDPTQGVRLISFAIHWIKAEIHEFVIKNWRIVKVATTKSQRKLFFNLRSMKKSTGLLTLDEAQAIANELNVSTKDVFEMQARLGHYDTSIESHNVSDDESDYVAPIQIEDDRYNPATLVEDQNNESNHQQALLTAMQGLDARAQMIIRRRWLDDDKATLHDLADEFQVSAERIRQLEKNALDKIKHALTPLFS